MNDNHNYMGFESQEDLEEIKETKILKLTLSTPNVSLGTVRFEKFSSFRTLVRSVAILKHIIKNYQDGNSCKGWHICSKSRSIEAFEEAKLLIIRMVQRETYGEEIKCTENEKPLSGNSPILNLDPFVDDDGMLRVGGQLHKSFMDFEESTP